MHISWFHSTNHQGNLWGFYGQATCTSLCVLLLSGTCPNGLHKIDEDSNRTITENQHTFGDIFGQYSFDGKTLEELFMGKDT